MGAISTLRIEVDGHFHGSSDVPRPWVARIDGIDPRYGLARTFVDALRDYESARRAWSGNLYGVVACFPLRDGQLYEVSRLRGSRSKRHVAREFLLVEDGKRRQIEPIEALARAEQLARSPGHDGPVAEYRLPEAPGVGVALVRELGTPHQLGWIVDNGTRLYRLRVGDLHEITMDSGRRIALAGQQGPKAISQLAAIDHLRAQITEASNV